MTVQIVGDGGRRAPLAAPKAADAAPAAPAQAAWFGVSKPAKTSVAAFSKSGLAVKVTATEAMTGLGDDHRLQEGRQGSWV